MALFEDTQSSRTGSRFGKLSSNIFFARNAANPRRVRHINGLNGQLICNVNDDPSLIRSASNSTLNFNRMNLPSLESSRRVERLVPPTGFWSTHGIVHDTEHWKQELASLASASGLGLTREDQKYQNKPTGTASSQNASRSGAQYSTRTGRFNEGTAKSRGRTGSKHSTAYSDALFSVPENEREMWMLQVLCQMLGTSNLEDVQSWLISATPSEKDQARTMINSALQGLKESERTSDQSQQPVDLDSLTGFVEKQKREERQASQKYMTDSLHRSAHPLQPINEESQHDTAANDALINSALKKHSALPLINTTTYQLSYPNYNQSPSSSLEALTTNNRTYSFNDSQPYQRRDEHEEPIETIHLDQDSLRASSPPLANAKKPSKPTALGRSLASQQQQHRFDSFQLNDDANDYADQAENRRQQPTYSFMKTTDFPNDEDEDTKARRIRDLQNKLSRQEEDSKKQIDELQTRQARLENALKLIVKQTAYGKRREQNSTENDKSVERSGANADSQKENESHSPKPSSTTNTRDDNRSSKSFAGVWKPDAAVLHRLQGN